MTAIIAIHIARGVPLRWLNDLATDVPVSVSAETAGPGDDIGIVLRDESRVEVEVKRGLRRGERLWHPLLKLAAAIHAREIAFGILIVCPNSSGSIRRELARDLARLGSGRTDGIASLGMEFQRLLLANALPLAICERLRIVTVHALAGEEASIDAALAQLHHLCADRGQVLGAWDRLYRDAVRLIAARGRRTAPALVRLLRAAGIHIGTDIGRTGAAALVAKVADWAFSAHEHFTVIGIAAPLTTDRGWINQPATIGEPPHAEEGNLASALERYQRWGRDGPGRSATRIDARTIGRFIRRCVVVAGPGMGKSTLLRKLARIYASEGIPVLRVRLSLLAQRMRETGSGFLEGMLAHGLDGSGVSVVEALQAGVEDWTFLCDGLDECGGYQDRIAQGLADLAAGHPHCRIVVTTRPIGYGTARLASWRHYDLPPMTEGGVSSNVSALVDDIYPPDSEKAAALKKFFADALGNSAARDVIQKSPLLLSLAVSLALRRSDFGTTRTDLYRRLFQLMREAAAERASAANLAEAIVLRVVEVLGFELMFRPVERSDLLLKRVGEVIANELGQPALAAQIIAEQCLDYWQDVGLVECVHHAGDEALTFSHKSFGEYAASLHLAHMSIDDRAVAIDAALAEPGLAEMLGFVSVSHVLDEIVEALRSRAACQGDWADFTREALRLCAASDAVADIHVIDTILTGAFDYLRGPNRRLASEFGWRLAKLCPRYGDEIAARARPLLDHPQPWTWLGAWTCLLAAGARHSEKDDVVGAIRKFPRIAPPRFGSLLGDHKAYDFDYALGETFARDAIRHFAGAPIDKATEDLMFAMMRPVRTGAFSFEIEKLLQSLGHADVGERIWRGLWSVSDDKLRAFEKKAARRTAAIGTLLDLISDLSKSDDREAADIDVPALAEVSAFMRACNMRYASGDDLPNWQSERDSEGVVELLRCSMVLRDIDADALGRGARGLKGELGNKKWVVGKDWLSQHTLSVDLPRLRWNQVTHANPDLIKLEAVLLRGPDWFVEQALDLITCSASPATARAIVDRLYDRGKSKALWAAVALSSRLDEGLAADLAASRLAGPVVLGMENIFNHLKTIDDLPIARLLPGLRNVLLSDLPEAASMAAVYCRKLRVDEPESLIDLLEAAYRHWEEREILLANPGRDSPRGRIAEALFNLRDPSEAEMLAIRSKSHPHVSTDSGPPSKPFPFPAECLCSEGFRDKLIFGLAAGVYAPEVLSELIREDVPLSPAQVKAILDMLSGPDPELRFAAMAILHPRYVATEEIDRAARKLARDRRREIRDAAADLLDRANRSAAEGEHAA